MRRIPSFILGPLFFALLTFSSAFADEVNVNVNVPETLSPGQTVSIGFTANYNPEPKCYWEHDEGSQQWVEICNDPTAITITNAMVIIMLPNGRIRGPYIMNLSNVTMQPNTTLSIASLKNVQLPSNLNTGEAVAFSVALFGPPHANETNPLSNCLGANVFFSQMQ
jgi:hypothetical protein